MKWYVTLGLFLFFVFITFGIGLLLGFLITVSVIESDVREIISEIGTDFNQEIAQNCDNVTPIIYRRPIVTPAVNGCYEQNLAIALLDTSLNVTRSNCESVLPLKNPPGFDVQFRITGPDPFDGVERMFCYLFYSTTQRKTVITFTGTFFIDEWDNDFNFPLTEVDQLNNYQPGIQCHTGFYNIYLSIRQQLLRTWSQFRFLTDVLYITGHSLGGALSTICAFDFVGPSGNSQTQFPQIPIVHYSFASPRTGNVAFANKYNELMPTGLRVYNTSDFIPELPPSIFEGNIYEHVNQAIPFTLNLGTIARNHIQAYIQGLPTAQEVYPC